MSNAPHARPRWPDAVALVAACLMAVTACEGSDPFAFEWNDAPDTVVLYSLQRPELNLVSGFNFFEGLPIRIEAADATGRWDVAVDTEAGEIVLAPPGALGVKSTARITALRGMRLEDVIEAPSDTLLYLADKSVPMRQGDVYVVKTNRTRGSFGRSCTYYAKLEPLVVDAIGGALTFRYVTNPICNSLDLIPPD